MNLARSGRLAPPWLGEVTVTQPKVETERRLLNRTI